MIARSFLLSTLFVLPAAAQGADLCANAQVIAGTGVFAFDNTAATTDGIPDPLCLAFGNSDIHNDVWFSWQAPNSGVFILDTCGQTTVDTKIGVLDGSCAGSVLACNDDVCGLQSSLSWNATGGNTYLLRVGTFPGAAGGTGTFTIVEDLPVLNPANGHYYRRVPAPGISWDDAKLAAESMSHLGLGGHLATLTDQQENDFVFGLGNVNNYWIGGFQDLTDPNYSEPAGGWKWITGEPWVYTNWLVGEPNNTGAFPSEDYLELLQSASFGTTWNDVHPQEHPAGYVVEFGTSIATAYCFGDGTGGVCPCGNTGGAGRGCDNNTGSTGAQLSATGSTSITNADLVLVGEGSQPGQPGLYFQGNNAINGGNGIPNGDGLRCAGGNVRRIQVRVASASGDSATTLNVAAQGVVSAGDTRRYQWWYRNPSPAAPCGTTFNLSNGLEIVWTP